MLVRGNCRVGQYRGPLTVGLCVCAGTVRAEALGDRAARRVSSEDKWRHGFRTVMSSGSEGQQRVFDPYRLI
jgi:hypothetical protein